MPSGYPRSAASPSLPSHGHYVGLRKISTLEEKFVTGGQSGGIGAAIAKVQSCRMASLPETPPSGVRFDHLLPVEWHSLHFEFEQDELRIIGRLGAIAALDHYQRLQPIPTMATIADESMITIEAPRTRHTPGFHQECADRARVWTTPGVRSPAPEPPAAPGRTPLALGPIGPGVSRSPLLLASVWCAAQVHWLGREPRGL